MVSYKLGLAVMSMNDCRSEGKYEASGDLVLWEMLLSTPTETRAWNQQPVRCPSISDKMDCKLRSYMDRN